MKKKSLPKNGIKFFVVRNDDGSIYGAYSCFNVLGADEKARIFSEDRAKELLRIERDFHKLKILHFELMEKKK